MAIIVPIIAKFIDEGLKDAQDSIKGATTTTEKWGAALDAAAGPAKAVTVAMVGAGFAVAKNAGAAMKANLKLAASFKAVGYPENAAAAMKYADSMQHVIGVSDEEIQATMQKLAAFKSVAASQDTMARATMAAADMSAAGFGTMDSAATALGKALENPEKNLGALTRMGIVFTKQQEQSIKTMSKAGDVAGAQAIILKEVESTFGGVAEASASGTAKMKLAWDEAAESIGTVLVPALGALNLILTKVANFAEQHSTAFLIIAGTVTALAAAIVVLNAAFKAFTAIKAAIAAIKALNLAMLANPYVLVAAAVVALVILIVKNWDKIKEWTQKVWGWIDDFLTSTWEKIKSIAAKVWDGILKVVEVAWKAIKVLIAVTNPWLFVLTHLDKVKGWVSAAWEWIKGKVRDAWNALAGIIRGSNPFQAIQGFLDTLKGWISNAFDWIADKIEDFMSKINGLVDNVQGAFDKAKSLADKIPRPGRNSLGGPAAVVVSRSLATPVSRSLLDGVPVPSTTAVAGRGGGDGVTITVNGALDPDAVARQIKRILEAADVRQGRERGAPRRVAW